MNDVTLLSSVAILAVAFLAILFGNVLTGLVLLVLGAALLVGTPTISNTGCKMMMETRRGVIAS